MSYLRALRWTAWMAVLLALVACGGLADDDGAPTSALTEEQAAELAENAMSAFEAGDYAGWSHDWSEAMKGAIKEADFLSFRRQVTDALGEYRSIESISIAPGNTAGYVRWNVLAQFERGRMQISFTFAEDGRLVEGVFPELMN